MKTNFYHLLLAASLSTAFGAAAAAPENAGLRLDAPSFEIVSEGSIFNPRRGHVEPPPPPPVPRPERLVLTGTMSYEGHSFAIFDGTSPQWRRVLQPGETIAGFKLAAVTSQQVRLIGADHQAVTLALEVGMSRSPDGSWSVSNSAHTN